MDMNIVDSAALLGYAGRMSRVLATLALLAGMVGVAPAQSGSSGGTVTTLGTMVPGNCVKVASASQIQDAGIVCSGGGGSTVTGSGTANTIVKWTGTNTVGNSTITGDTGGLPPLSPDGIDLGTLGALSNQIANSTTPGTTINKLACDDGTGKVVICSHTTSTTNQPIGTVVNGAGTTGSATVAIIGFITVCFDNQTTARHYAIGSTTSDGCLHDTGATTLTAGQPNYFVWTANAGANTNGVYRLLTADDFAAAGCTNTCVTAAAILTSTALVTGSGLRGVQTPSATATLSSGGNMAIPGTLVVSGNVTEPTQSSADNSTFGATTAYVTTAVNNAIAGVNPAIAVQAATTVAGDTSSFTYLNGAAGIGATLTGPTNNVAVAIDGFTFTAVGQRLLVKNDTQSPSGAFNGVYSLTILQGVANKPVLTRALDYDTSSDINNTGAIPVINGTVNGTTQWVITSSVTTVGTDPLTYAQFSANPANNLTAASALTSGNLVQAAGNNRTTSDAGVAAANVVTAASAATATGQICKSSGSSKTCTYIDYPLVDFIPAANCNNATAGAAWSIGSGGTVTCRAGTNNLGGYIAITDTASTFATFQVAVPEDWDTGTNPYIRFQLASTDATNGHTIIPSIQVACYKGDGSTTDDVAPNAAHSLSTTTLNGNANRFWSTSNVQLNSTDVTGCVAGALMQVTVGRATDTATNAEFYGATMTFPRLIVVQAN